MTTTTKPVFPAAALIIEAHGSLDQKTLDAIHHLARSQESRCDAIGESGSRCTLRAGHPGEIHEEYHWGRTYRFRMAGDKWEP